MTQCIYVDSALRKNFFFSSYNRIYAENFTEIVSDILTRSFRCHGCFSIKPESKFKSKLSLVSSILSITILFFSFGTNAALSATTANTIQGTEPYLNTVLTNEIKAESFSLFGFTFSGTDYYASNLASLYIDPKLYSPSNLKSAITVGKLNILSATDAVDDDGDNNFTLSAKTPLSVSVSIYNDDGIDISNDTTKFSDVICSDKAPYKAKIKVVGDLSLTTQYGDPRNKDYTNITADTNNKQPTNEHEVTIAGICSLKPASMKVYTGGALSIPGGYNTAKFNLTNGFKVDSGFPSTGFYKAVFSLVGSGNDQTKYRCKSADNNGKIVLSSTSGTGSNCTVTYNKMTKADFTSGGTPTITMEYSANGATNWTQIDSFTIPTPTKWAIGKGANPYSNADTLWASSIFKTLNECRTVGPNAIAGTTTWDEAAGTSEANKTFRQKYLYTRAELTNSPHANTAEGSSIAYSPNYFSRNADGTFMGEWGYVYDYTGSGWAAYSPKVDYWTAEAWSTDYQFVVNSYGYVLYHHPSYVYATICRGE